MTLSLCLEAYETVTELGLDHGDCHYSTGLDDSVTAGQGKLGWDGFFEIPCPECAAKMAESLNYKTEAK